MKRRRAVPGREWRQFKLLYRGSWRRLLQSMTFARDSDPGQFLLWAITLVLLPPLGIAVSRMLAYPSIAAAAPPILPVMAAGARLFFLVYNMLAAALLAALVWDALFPDRTDQEIVGVLPVRPRTLAAARLAAVVTLITGFSAALNVPAGLFFGVAQLSLPDSPWLPRLFVGHVLVTMGASWFVFFTLMMLRGVVGIVGGERVAARLAVALQLLTVISFVEIFLFLPGVMASVSRQMRSGGPDWNPLVWFAAAYEWVVTGAPQWLGPTGVAASVTVVSVVLVVGLSLVPSAWLGRRALETSTRERTGGVISLARLWARLTIRPEPVRGMFLFAVGSLIRSRRHALVLATYLGIAVALSFVRLISSSLTNRISIDEPHRFLLTIPMVFVFLTVFGLRSAFAIPTDVDANWPFRLATPSARNAVSATRRLLYALGVLPITLIWLAVVLSIWETRDAITSAAFVMVSGSALVELALAAWTKIPFAAAHEPAVSTMRSKWALAVFFLHLWAFLLPEIQRDALTTVRGTTWYIGFFAAVTLILRIKRERALRRETATFDAVEKDALEVLNLSEAAN